MTTEQMDWLDDQRNRREQQEDLPQESAPLRSMIRFRQGLSDHYNQLLKELSETKVREQELQEQIVVTGDAIDEYDTAIARLRK